MTINTVNTKFEQLKNTYFSVGTGPEVILIMGSCRAVPYVGYFDKWNEQNGNRFTINFIDPFSFNWNDRDQRTDYNAELLKLETDERLLSMLRSVKYFIHEWYQNAGLFNTFKEQGKSIYDFGMSPEIDICAPNYNDVFVLFGDIVSFDLELRKKAIQDWNVLDKLSPETEKEIFMVGQKNLERFYEICRKSDIPHMEHYFRATLPSHRLFHTFNHVSKYFTLEVFKYLIIRLNLVVRPEFLTEIRKVDMYDSHYTKITEYDVKWYGLHWGEKIHSLREKL